MSRFVRVTRFLIFPIAAFVIFSAACGNKPEEAKSEPAAAAPAPEPAPAAPVDTAISTDPATAPETILMTSSYGDVIFTHKQHYERLQNNCATCHPSIFPQSRAPLNYGKARHRSAEEMKSSCATCHGISGTAFTSERNCQRCHDITRGRGKKNG